MLPVTGGHILAAAVVVAAWLVDSVSITATVTSPMTDILVSDSCNISQRYAFLLKELHSYFIFRVMRDTQLFVNRIFDAGVAPKSVTDV